MDGRGLTYVGRLREGPSEWSKTDRPWRHPRVIIPLLGSAVIAISAVCIHLHNNRNRRPSRACRGYRMVHSSSRMVLPLLTTFVSG